MTDEETFYSPAEIRHSIGASGSFSLNNVSGDVRIRGVDGGEVIVRARWDGGGGDQPLPLAVRRTTGSLSIETDLKQGWLTFRNRSDVEFDITVPNGARVDIQAVSADIEAKGLTGDQSYKTVSGDLSIDAAGGRVSATTVSGDVNLQGALPLEANINTTSGDTDATAPLFQPVRMRTVSGDMSVRGGFAPGPQHTVESVSGDLSIEATTGLTVDTKRGLDFSKKNSRPIVSGDGGASLRFRSLSGDVRLSGFIATPAPAAAATAASLESFVDEPPPLSKEDSLEILRALERGDIDIDEASRRLEGAGNHG